MADKITTETRAVPALMIEALDSAEKDLTGAGLELKAAKEQHKDSKAHYDMCQTQFNEASRVILNIDKKDGFPPDAPMADAAAEDGDEWGADADE